ncbi:UbiA family prenyltransferase [Mariniblastus sp.]|nr:UbiA family prenyltransferase [bacterium]MDB4545126.1 UbiA family prenyltransferase [bacterium]MDC3224181.1 UbiA family prenyltransferase [Mariniblastus sp.]
MKFENEDPSQTALQDSKIIPWLRLLRLSALPTAISNILMAFLLVHQTWTPTLELCLLVLASSLLYSSGMVLNDVFDIEIDRIQRPSRPLPSGKISHQTAKTVGYLLLFLGVLVASLAGWIGSGSNPYLPTSPFTRATLIAILLAACILLYNGALKRTLLAPFLMGSCRGLNVLLGTSTLIPLATGMTTSASPPTFLSIPLIAWWVSISIGTLICGVTLLGRNEAVESQKRLPLFIACGFIIAGITGIGSVVYCPMDLKLPTVIKQFYPLIVAVISLTIIRRVVGAAVVATPSAIQTGVISVLRSLIILDAVICFLAAPGSQHYALIVLSLLIPNILLSRYISTT